MKRIFLSIIVSVMLAAMLAFSANAADTVDYGYYDTNCDGKVEIVDVLSILDKMLNSDKDVSLSRVLNALKITVSNAVVTASIKSIDYTNGTVTLNCSYLENIVLPFSAFGFDNEPNMILYEEGKVTMTVPTPAKTFFENNFDVSKIYAVKAECRYETSDLVLTVGEVSATQNGETVTLFAEPAIVDGVVMVPVNVVEENFGAEVSYNQLSSIANFEKNGASVSASVVIVGNDCEYVDAIEVFKNLGAAVIFDEAQQSITVKELIYPTIKVSNASGAPGEEVTVDVTIVNNPGFAGAEFKINYDSNAASYVSGKKGANSFYTAFSTNEGANPVKVVLANLSLKDIAGDVAIGTVTFKIAEDAAPGTYSLELFDTNLYDAYIVHINSTVIGGSITVTE